MRPHLKCCTPSVRPSAHVSVCLYVNPVRTIYSKLESCRNFKFGGHMTLNTSNWENKFKIWCPKIEVTENENLKIVFCAYLRQAQIDLHQTKTKMIFGRFYTYRRVHLINKNALYFVIFVCLSVCLCAYHSPHIPFVHSILERRRKYMYANRTCLAFVPRCRRSFTGTKCFSYLHLAFEYCQNDMHCTPLSLHKARSTSS